MDKHQNLSALQEAWSTCQGCMLCHERRAVVFGYGNPDAQILVVGEAPGANEDREGVPFVGQAGQLLDQFLTLVSVDPQLASFAEKEEYPATALREALLHYIYYTNVVCCRPPENRDPTPGEIETCRSRLHEIIYTVDPLLIIGIGRISAEALLGKKVTITQRRGDIVDIEIPGRVTPVRYPLLIVLHTSYLLRVNDFNQAGGMAEKTFNDFLLAHRIVDEYNWLHYGIPHPKDRPKENV